MWAWKKEERFVQNVMRYIYEVYRERSFSRAARNLYISQPALSACIKKVEAEIGMQLFDRSTLPIELTEAGKLYVQAIKKIMAAENELHTQLSELSHLEYGHLVIGGANFFSCYMLPPLIQAFNRQYPGVTLKIAELDTNVLYDAATQEGIDLILDGGSCDQVHFEKQRLFEECLLLAVPRDNPLNKRFADRAFCRADIVDRRHRAAAVPPVDLQAFCEEPLVLQNPGHDTLMRSKKLCEHAGFTPRKIIYVNQLTTAANMAVQGLGCTFVTDTLVKLVPLANDALRFYMVSDPIAWREVFIAWRRKETQTLAMRRFIAIAQRIVQQQRADGAAAT